MSLYITSLKKLKIMHKVLGGNQQGFFILINGYDIESNKEITSISNVAYHHPKQVNWSYKLVKGTPYKTK